MLNLFLWGNFYNFRYKPEIFPETTKFNPDRWLDKSAPKVDVFAYTPFSAGSRNCIGQHLA